jgi:hypothetical protein
MQVTDCWMPHPNPSRSSLSRLSCNYQPAELTSESGSFCANTDLVTRLLSFANTLGLLREPRSFKSHDGACIILYLFHMKSQVNFKVVHRIHFSASA